MYTYQMLKQTQEINILYSAFLTNTQKQLKPLKMAEQNKPKRFWQLLFVIEKKPMSIRCNWNNGWHLVITYKAVPIDVFNTQQKETSTLQTHLTHWMLQIVESSIQKHSN